MNGRTQIISIQETCPQKNRTVSEDYVVGQTFLWITENNLMDTNQLGDGLLEPIVSPSNLNKDYLQVKRNKGSGGMDKMEVESLKIIQSRTRTMSSMIHFIEDKLFLKVNRDESQSAPIRKVKFLGYSFYKSKEEGRLRIHRKSVSKMKAKIKELTSRSNGWGNARRKEALRQYITGWVNYFKLADMKNLLLKIDEWYRKRIRMVIWKRIRTGAKNLIILSS